MIESEEDYVASLRLLKLCFRPELEVLAADLVIDLLTFISQVATRDAVHKVRPQPEPPKCCDACFWTWEALNDAAEEIEKGAA
ncbi:hypothetical protein [Streptomyces sp. H39-S7]|uniref:hypothetical protein n=1 Tax=Streptomyces sp. H39-S7 TaxID=3004357 RepID=UPI0022AF38AF|nr:hypothetical protein [Streptomyces sp. H39-S7]MCZ4119010.1 hypothetical protein [Streptomyces sp. H39-S7]